MKKLDKSGISLIVSTGINSIVSLFANTFMVAYLFNNNFANTSKIAVFYIITYFVLATVFFLITTLLKKFNKLIVYRIAVIFKVVFVLLIVVLKQQLSEYLVLIAILHGLSEAAYWSSFHTMRNEIISESFFQKYMSIASIVDKTVGIIFPLILGTMIDAFSFENIALLIFALALIQLTFTIFISNKRPTKGVYSVKNFYKELKEKKDGKLIKMLHLNFFITGFKNSVGTIMLIIVALTYSSNTELGFLNSIFALLVLGILILFSIFYDAKKHSVYLIISGVFGFFTCLAILFGINPVTIIIFNGGFNIAATIPNLIADIRRNTLIKKLKLKYYIPENMGITELCIGAGRVLAYSTIFLIVNVGGLIHFQILGAFMGVVLLAFSIGVARLEKEIQKAFGDASLGYLTYFQDFLEKPDKNI